MKLTLFLVATLLVAFAQSQNNVLNFIIDDFGWGNGASLVIDGTDYAAGIEQQAVEVKLSGNINVPAEDTANHIVESDDTDITGINYVYGFDPCAFLVGCVRNMEVRVWNGLDGREFTSNIFSSSFSGTGYDGDAFAGEWAISSPKSSNSRYTLQYDSTPGMNLNLQGLGGIDITVGGLAREITFFVITDLNANFVVELFDVNGNTCSGVINVIPEEAGQGEYDISEFRYSLSLDTITGSCVKTNIGAIQLSIESNDALDAIIRRFSVFGVPPPSDSNTPSPVPSPSSTGTGTPVPSVTRTPAPSPSGTGTGTPGPSQTRTPAPSATRTPAPSASNTQTRTPAPSASRTPAPSASNTQTPSPSGPCIRFCQCASFTCALALDNDDNFNDVIRLSDLNRNNFYFDDEDGQDNDDDNNGGYIVINLNDDDDDNAVDDGSNVPNVQNGDDDDDDNSFGGVTGGNGGLSTTNNNVIVLGDGDDDDDQSGSTGNNGNPQVVYVPVNVPVNIPVPVPVPGPTVEVPVIQIVEVPVPVPGTDGGDDDDNTANPGPIIINPPNGEDDDEVVIPVPAIDDDDNSPSQDDDDDNASSSSSSSLIASVAFIVVLAVF